MNIQLRQQIQRIQLLHNPLHPHTSDSHHGTGNREPSWRHSKYIDGFHKPSSFLLTAEKERIPLLVVNLAKDPGNCNGVSLVLYIDSELSFHSGDVWHRVGVYDGEFADCWPRECHGRVPARRALPGRRSYCRVAVSFRRTFCQRTRPKRHDICGPRAK